MVSYASLERAISLDDDDDDDIGNEYCQCWRWAPCRPTLALTIRPRFDDDDGDDDDDDDAGDDGGDGEDYNVEVCRPTLAFSS